MRKHLNSPEKSLQPKGNELLKVFIYLQKRTATASMISAALSIYRPNICRYKRKLEKAGHLAELKRGICKVTKHRAAYLTTNSDLFPKQLNLLK